MSQIDYRSIPDAVRDDIVDNHRRAWERLGRPGTWWTGAERIAIAAEVRHAPSCALCARRKEALSPYSVSGTHDHLGALPDAAVEVIHGMIAHPSRLTQRWYEKALAGGLSEGQYVELVATAATVVMIDTFCRAMGAPPHPLPAAQPGSPSRYRPAEARHNGAWVPTIVRGEHGAAEADLFAGPHTSNIRRALTLVPDDARTFYAVNAAQYVPPPTMLDFSVQSRAITRAQVELVAARVSAHNQCFY